MTLYVNTNISSMIAQRYLSKNTNGLSTSLERLSSGYRINHAGDDAAGLALAEGLRSQVLGTEQAIENIQDGINMLQIAEGGMEIMSDCLQRMRELSVQAANCTYATAERNSMLAEIRQRIAEINRISKTATYNGIALLSDNPNQLVLQIGPTSAPESTLNIRDAFGVVTTETLDVDLDPSVTGATWTPADIRAYMDRLDKGISKLVSYRANIGAYQNRVEAANDNLTIMSQNLSASESRIRDTDIAKESSTLARYQILQQASASVLTQANQLPAVALSILQG